MTSDLSTEQSKMWDILEDSPRSWVAQVLEDPHDPDGVILQFPDEMMTKLGWFEGDTITWNLQDNGTAILTKKAA